MKWSFTAVGLFILGLIGVAIILLFQSLTTNNENDYYLLKEITEASMFDAIDYKVYRETGNLKIKERVFVESFTRRFAESTLFVGNTYTIKMFDIIEAPPKATIYIDTGIGKFTIYNDTQEYSVVNNLTGILEYNDFTSDSIRTSSIFSTGSDTGGYIKKTYENECYSFISIENKKVYFSQVLRVPDILNVEGGLIKINDVQVLGEPIVVKDNIIENVAVALLNRELDWVVGGTGYFKNKYYDVDNYYNGKLNNVSISKIKLCDNGVDSRCNGKNTYLFNWSGDTENSDKSLLFVKYKMKWNYEIFK